MKNNTSLQKKLNEIKVPYFNMIEIVNEELVKTYTDNVLKGIELPENICMEQIEILDKEAIISYNTLLREDKQLPKDVIVKRNLNDNDMYIKKYYYSNKFKFYNKVLLTESEINISIQIIQTKHLESISKSMIFFKILAWIVITLSLIGFIIALANA